MAFTSFLIDPCVGEIDAHRSALDAGVGDLFTVSTGAFTIRKDHIAVLSHSSDAHLGGGSSIHAPHTAPPTAFMMKAVGAAGGLMVANEARKWLLGEGGKDPLNQAWGKYTNTPSGTWGFQPSAHPYNQNSRLSLLMKRIMYGPGRPYGGKINDVYQADSEWNTIQPNCGQKSMKDFGLKDYFKLAIGDGVPCMPIEEEPANGNWEFTRRMHWGVADVKTGTTLAAAAAAVLGLLAANNDKGGGAVPSSGTKLEQLPSSPMPPRSDEEARAGAYTAFL